MFSTKVTPYKHTNLQILQSYSQVSLGLSESQLSKVVPSDSTTRKRHEEVLEKFFSKVNFFPFLYVQLVKTLL